MKTSQQVSIPASNGEIIRTALYQANVKPGRYWDIVTKQITGVLLSKEEKEILKKVSILANEERVRKQL